MSDRLLASDLQEQMARMDPYRFEQLVVDLLFGMGYGGSRDQAAKVTKKSNDEGIDGVINEDRLGLDVIYVQAKRWQNSAGRKEIQSFVGALAGQQASKGVFITTSDFAQTAIDYARNVPQKVILIEGARLAELMIEHNIGVTSKRTLSLKRIDSDFGLALQPGGARRAGAGCGLLCRPAGPLPAGGLREVVVDQPLRAALIPRRS